MSRKRSGLPLHGWINLDKPEGLSSAAVVARVRRMTGAAKAGHGGTLDPLASGILPIALGEATKTVSYVMDGEKSYRFRIRWGEARTTDDREGEISDTCPSRPATEDIRAALATFTGLLSQTPPLFSAIKISGRRACDLARRGQDVPTLLPRDVMIYDLSLLDQPDRDHADFLVRCGKGTYIRSLARDLAQNLGTCGHVAALRRVACGPFHEETAISLERLDDLGHSAPNTSFLLPLETVLADIPALALSGKEVCCLRNGQPLAVSLLASPPPSVLPGSPLVAMMEGRAAALVSVVDGMVRPMRVFNLLS